MAGRGEPWFSYTSGLTTTYQHPEIVVFGLDIKTGYNILHAAVDMLRAGKSLEPGRLYDEILENLPVCFREIPNAVAFERFPVSYRTQPDKKVRFLQMVWPDCDGAFPWQKSFDMSLDALQPRLWLVH